MRPTPELLRELVEYDPESGALIWKARPDRRFNSKLAGKPAFSQQSGGYFIGRLQGGNYKAHRIAWAVHYGQWPEGLIDHINGNGLDNRIENLRVVDAVGNAQNQSLRSTNTSGEQGISWFPRDNKWWVKITVRNKVIHIGFYSDIRDAVIARNAAYRAAGFHRNHGRQP